MSSMTPYMVLMTRWTCVILIVGIMACASSSEQRGSQGRPLVIKAKSGDDIMVDLAVRLKLTEAQRGTAKPIIQFYADRRNDLMVNSLQGGGNLKSGFQSLREETEKLMGVVINEEQMKEFRKYLDEEQKGMDDGKGKRNRGRGGRGGGRGGGFGGSMGNFDR